MRSLYLIQQVDLNLLTVILLNLLNRLPYACRIPTLGEDRSQALLRQAKDREGIGLDRPVTALARHHLHGGCRSGQASLHRLDVKVPHSREG